MLRVRFVAGNRVGARLRTQWPAEALVARGWDASSSLAMPEPGSADVLWVHRPLHLETVLGIQAHQAAGAKVIVDEDDDLTALPVGHGWKPPAAVLAWHDTAIQLADHLSVSTPALASVYGPLAQSTSILRNYLPARVATYADAEPRRTRPANRVYVGWTGIIDTHAHDLEWLGQARALEMLADPAWFTTTGDHRTAKLLGVRARSEMALGFTFDERELYGRMARAHIGIVPLAPNRFNEAKSWLKALEYMELGCPVVVVDLPEQRAIADASGAALVAESPEHFVSLARELIERPTLRNHMSALAQGFANGNTLEHHIHEREALLYGLGMAPGA